MAAAIQSTGGSFSYRRSSDSFRRIAGMARPLRCLYSGCVRDEFTSNTALAATMLPLLAAAAPVLRCPS